MEPLNRKEISEKKELAKAKKAEKQAFRKDNCNIKALKFPLILSSRDRELLDGFVKKGKEFYNLLINQRLEAEKFNTQKYYEYNPDKLIQKQEKEKAFQDRIQKEIEAGIRQPRKKHLTLFMSPIQMRHEELQNIGTDVLTHCVGSSKIEDLTQGNGDRILKLNKAGIPQVYLSSFTQSAYGTKLRSLYPEFDIMPSPYWMGICDNVHKAFEDYLKNKMAYMSGKTKKYPKPPSFTTFRDDFSLKGKAGEDNNSSVRIVKTGLGKNARIYGISNKHYPNGLKINAFKPVNGKIITTAIIKNGDKYFLNITFEERKVHWPAKNSSIGIDIGIARNIQLSTGEYKQLPIEQIKLLEEKKKKQQRRLKRMVLKSKNYYKEQTKIAKIDAKIANIRKYHSAMFATEIIRDNETIIIEDLKIKNMTKSSKGDSEAPGKMVAQKSGLNKSMLRVAPYMFRMHIENKAKEYGRTVIAVNPAYTSQTCSSCGEVHKESRKDQEHFKCVSCGFEMNADHNAAINILNKGVKNAVTTDKRQDSISFG